MTDKQSFVARLISWRTSSVPNESNLCPELPKTATGKVQKYVLRGKPAISKQRQA